MFNSSNAITWCRKKSLLSLVSILEKCMCTNYDCNLRFVVGNLFEKKKKQIIIYGLLTDFSPKVKHGFFDAPDLTKKACAQYQIISVIVHHF